MGKAKSSKKPGKNSEKQNAKTPKPGSVKSNGTEQTETEQQDIADRLADARRQELELLNAERAASERVRWVRERLATWEARQAKAERRVATWRERLTVAEADLAFQHAARAEGPVRGWQSPQVPDSEPAAVEVEPTTQDATFVNSE